MLIITTILFWIIVVLAIFKSYKYMFYRPLNFPPGPPRLPIVGSYLFLLLINRKQLHKAALFLSEYYKSKVIGFYVGDTPTIVAQDYDSVRTVLLNSDYDGRTNLFLAKMRDPEFQIRGIFFTKQEFWKEQRRFALRHLRDYGFGRRFSELEIEVRDEICGFLDMVRTGPKFEHEFKIMKGNKILAPNIFFATMSNAFLKVLSGVKFTREEQKSLFETGVGGMIFQKYTDDYGLMLSIVPWIRHVFPNWSHYNQVKQGNGMVYNFVKEIIDKHIRTYDDKHERNFIDLYIREMKEAQRLGIENSSYHYEQLILVCTDFFFPALTAVPVTFSFLIQRFLIQPELLTKMQLEIDEIVGGGRLPELDDRINLPYTEACIREIMRLETLVPSSIGHCVLKPTKCAGYDIPEGTFVLPGLYAMHNAPEIWGDPDVFRPERFIGSNGKLDLKLDKSLPFGAGKRLCAGETFARNTLFLFISAFFQNFDIKCPNDEPFPHLSKNITGLITLTPDFWVEVTPR